MLVNAFETQVEERPDKIAVRTEQGYITYTLLNQIADGVASLIQSQLNQGTQVNIALFLEHGIEMIAAILGTLKAGGAYVPIPHDYPQKRISYILENSEAQLIISNAKCWERASLLAEERGIPLLKIQGSDQKNGDRQINHESKNKLAYILYTSGSTGKPKGVQQTHENVLYYIENWTRRFSISEKSRMTLFSSFSHDGAGQDMFSALLNGATLYPYDLRSRESSVNISGLLRDEKITHWHSVPSLFNFFVNTLEGEEEADFHDLRFILLGGEPFRGYEIEVFKEYFPDCTLANVYGQTESSVDSIWTIQSMDEIDKLIIGQPLNRTQIFVLDKEGREVEPFEVGEIMIGCPHISPGYWRDEEASTKAFDDDPELGRLYWTGDLGRLLSDGNIEFMGRNDFQVKIRGFRVEIGEVETTLLKYIKVQEAVVVAKKTNTTSMYLTAFLTAEIAISIEHLRACLAEQLPDYMIPSSFIQLEKMPLTSSGKIDRKALAEMEVESRKLKVDYKAPETEMEKTVAETWEEILKLEQVGIQDNFFDLGGSSFDIIQINSRLRTTLEREIPMVKMFEFPTVRKLATYLDSGKDETSSPKQEREIPINRHGQEVAVIGMAGRFPGANSIDEFWENLKKGEKSITFFPDETLRESGIPDELIENPNYVKAKGILEEIDTFDARFFNYTPRQAEVMDPQLRLFHECTWEALEDAGYDSQNYKGLIGLYAGNVPNFQWQGMVHFSRMGNPLDQFESRLLAYHFSTRISYNFHFNGPAVNIQTACSTSLSAIHMGFTALTNYECDMALAGGVSISLPHKTGHLYQQGMLLSKDGHCKAFDAGATGTIFGDGAGVVVLKRLEQALQDGDLIHAVIKGTAINNDGIRKVGYTAPSVEGQAEVIQAALKASHVETDSIGYIETHGTGTVLGDPIEIEALKQVFKDNRNGTIAIGSVKSNIGHLNAAAGVTSFIKTVLSIKHRTLLPSVNFEIPNPDLDLITSPFYVNVGLLEWENHQYPIRAGVSSFGFGGTNAHVVLEAAPQSNASSQSRKYQLLLISAASRNSLEKASESLAKYLEQQDENILPDAAYTLQTRRRSFSFRKALVCQDTKEAIKKLAIDEQNKIKGINPGEAPGKIEFRFPGTGNPGKLEELELYTSEALFEAEVKRCIEMIPSEISSHPIKSIKSELQVFLFEYALAQLLMEWGIQPDTLSGEGQGQYTAACLQGKLSIEEAIRSIYEGEDEGLRPLFSELKEEANLQDSKQNNQPGKRKNVVLLFGSLRNEKSGSQQEDKKYTVIPLISLPKEAIPDTAFLLGKIGLLWTYGFTIDWERFYKNEKRNPVSLPPYSFDRQRYWIDDVSLENISGMGKKTSTGTGNEKEVKTSPALFARPDWLPGYLSPTDEVDHGLVEICQEMFGYEKIGMKDNFFDLGGNSLSVINFVSEIHKRLQVKIQIQDVFDKTELQELSLYIKESEKAQYLSIQPVEEKEYYPLSSAQKSLFIITQVEKNISTAYNLPQVLIINGQPELTHFEEAFKKIVNRHLNFQTTFAVVKGKPVQIFHRKEENAFHINYSRLNTPAETGTRQDIEEKEMEGIVHEFIRPFDISKLPLFRVQLYQVGKEKHLLLLDMHHIISDGLSMAILVREFLSLYNGEELPDIRVQYKDFSERQNTPEVISQLKKQEAFWLEQFQGEIPSLNLTTNYPRQSMRSFEGCEVVMELDKELHEKIKKLNKETGTTLYMVLLGIFTILMSKYTGQDDIIVGVPAGGRSHPDLEGIIGMFVNTLALRNQPKNRLYFREFLQTVKHQALQAFDNQDYPFEDLVKQLGLSKSTNRNPLFDLLFVSENLGIPKLEVQGLTFSPFEYQRTTSHMDLVFYLMEAGDTILLKLEYATALFKASSVEDMLKHFRELLKQVVEDPGMKLGDLHISFDLIRPQTDILEESQEDFNFSF